MQTSRRQVSLMRCRQAGALTLLLVAILTAGSLARAEQKANSNDKQDFRSIKTKYYVINSDLSDEAVLEAGVRMTIMAEEYHRRTKGFGGTIRKRLPFYLFSNKNDYYQAGGIQGSAGVYDGKSLKAIADRRYGDYVWQIVQHE
ncbi:MAG: hypothetical protein ACLFVU_15130, partial [Phycisphaerae bacterium]